MSNTQELNLFFPLNHLNPMGWLNDFVTPQIMKDKNSIVYSMLYKNYENSMKQEVKDKIKEILEKTESKSEDEKSLFSNYITTNTKKFEAEKEFLYINGGYSDILENNISTRNLADGEETDTRKYLEFMNTIQPYQMAFFQPYMRLFYGWKDDPKNKNEKFQFIEFPFSQYFDLDTILSAPNAFMEGSGVKNINVETQFTIGTKRNSKISINYYFSNMNILTRKLEPPPGTNPKYGFSFMKLFSNIGIKKELIVLEYGYHVDPQLTSQHGIPEEICVLINSRETKKFGILKTGHNFKFNKEGGVEISVNYVNLAEAFLQSDNNIMIPTAEKFASAGIINRNVFKRSPGALQLVNQYKQQKEKLAKIKEDIEDITLAQRNNPERIDRNNSSLNDFLRQKKRRIDNLRKQEIETNKSINTFKRQMVPYFKNLFLDIITSNYDLYSISFNTKKDQESKKYSLNSDFNLISPFTGKEIKIADLSAKEYSVNDFFTSNSISTKVIDNMENILNRIFNAPRGLNNSDNKENHILFFPLRALIRAAYLTLDDPDTPGLPIVPAIIFGNLTCRVYDKTYNINTGNILIEVEAFQKWMHRKFINSGHIDISFGHFLKEIMDDLVPDAVYRNKTYPQPTTRISIQDYNPNFFIKENFFSSNLKYDLEHSSPTDKTMLKLSEYVYNSYQGANTKPLILYSKLNISTHNETTAGNYSVSSNKLLRLNEKEDATRGIPHLVIGSDRGLFLSADFNQIDLKGLRSGIALQAMTDENSSYFFYKYSISADVLGSSIFNHGSIICVPTPPLGLTGVEYDIGIVGYYKVKGLKETLDANGSYKTNISGDWFWDGGTFGKRGKITSATPNENKKITEIKDYVESDVYDPIKYVELLIETDINTLVNFGLNENKNDKKKDKKAKSSAPAKTSVKKDKKKEADVPTQPVGQSRVKPANYSPSSG